MSEEKLVMPDDKDVEGRQPDDISSAIVAHIQDDIEDGKTFREWRKTVAIAMSLVSVAFYMMLAIAMFCLALGGPVLDLAVQEPTVAITVFVILAAVPTLIMVSVARAVFGKRGSYDSPYAPLQAIIHLMKEMKG